MSNPNLPGARPGYRQIFRPWRTNPQTGQREYPRNSRFFVMWVRDDGN